MVLGVLGGCSGVRSFVAGPLTQVGEERDVVVILATRDKTARACRAMGLEHPRVAGCFTRIGTAWTIYCPLDHPAVSAARCVAHEVCHLLALATRREDQCE